MIRRMVQAVVVGVAVFSVFGGTDVKLMKVNRALTEEARGCIDCHAGKTPGIVQDWRKSRHGHVGVSCVDCHSVTADSPLASQGCPGVRNTGTWVTVVVTSKACSKCHPAEVQQFSASGHFRAASQIAGKQSMQDLMYKYEGQNHPQFKSGPKETGCIQCHGTTIKLGADRRPLPGSWPNAGIGNVNPDGSVGNCSACHTRHRFDIAEARKPAACASCHLGPDHPDIEIFTNSKHGQIFATEGDNYVYDTTPDAWEPGDYRAPTCAVCHMSGIGDLKTTHNVSSRLYWNLWAKESKPRNSPDPTSPLTGDAAAGRARMKKVCSNCHTPLHTDGFFTQADKLVKLYNEAYYKPSKRMLDVLKDKGLLRENPWTDPFQIAYYHLWHHEGRRMRQGALMGGPDYAQWHGTFEVMQRLYEMKAIFKKRLQTNKIEP
ncbi:MAG: beta-ketoacyl-ACP synthase [Kiritimatiellaeota bacterium]|nr:beta-ketoacyl-ACP synthase [Kiritimatiellota bacterium]